MTVTGLKNMMENTLVMTFNYGTFVAVAKVMNMVYKKFVMALN